MEEEQNQNDMSKKNENNDAVLDADIEDKKDKKISTEKPLEEIVLELEDKLARSFAEMENQRRRFEKEKEEAFEYGGFTFAKEALNLIDNLERSKQILSNDESLKNSEALKKTLEHFDIINKDLISILIKSLSIHFSFVVSHCLIYPPVYLLLYKL